MHLVKNHFWALLCLVFSFELLAQQVPELKVQFKDLSKYSKVALQVTEARNSVGVFQNTQPLRLSQSSETHFKTSLDGKYQLLDVLQTETQKLLLNRPEQLTLVIPTNSQEIIKLDLVRVNILAEGFHVFTSDQQKLPYNYKEGVYYRGIIQGREEGTMASISIFENQIIGSISDDYGNLVIQPNKDTPGQMILFYDRDIKQSFNYECLTDDANTVVKPIEQRGIQAAGDCVRVYVECDYALYVNKGSSKTETVNWISAVFNNLATLYANESINTAISEVFVWTSQDGYSKTDSYTALTQFRNARTTFNGDIAHLAALGGSNIGGIAWLDVLCSSYKYAYSNIYASYSNVPTYSWTVEVMTHEMGHNLGSNHTHWCGWTGGALDNCYTPEGGCSKGPAPTNGGTIMSYCHLTGYGINFNNGFGTQPGNKIRAEVAAATCLGTSCGGGGGCNAPTGLNITNITQTTATGNWNAVSGATSYTFEYKTNAGTTWTTANTSNTSYNMTGLTANTLYNTRVKATCSSGSSNYSSTVNFTTSSSGCGTPTGLAVTNITQTTATVSWNAVSGALSYNFQYKLTSSPTWSQSNFTSTSVSLTGMSPATSYDVRVQTVCAGSTSAFSNTVTFVTQASSGYCTSRGNNSNYEWVKRVNLGSIDRNSGKDGGYYDATALVTDVSKSSTYTINYQAGSTGGSGTLYWRVWIDFNNNNSFADAGEQVVSVANKSLNLLSSNITIPSGAATAKVRMRVSVKYGGYASYCQTFAYGEVEDYSVNIKAAGTLVNPNNTQNVIDEISLYPNPFSNNFNLEFNANVDQKVQYLILDPLGRLIKEESMDAVQGRNTFKIETGNLVPSTYLVQIKSSNESYYRKMMKLE